MAGQLASLGLQSNVLTNELLEKLKAAEVNARIKPYETKIETNTAKQKALTELTTKLSAFQTAVSSLGDATAFSKRKVTPSVTGDSAAATLTASNGVSVQNLSVKVNQIAQKDVFQSKGLVKDTDRVLTGNQNAGSFTIRQNGKEYKISVDANTTYEGLAERINSVTDGNVIAKIVSTGEAGTPYRFTLSSKETGADNAITFRTDNADGEAILSNFGWNLKKDNIAEADLTTGYSFSGGTKAGSVADLKTAIGQDLKFTLFAGTEKFEITASATDTYEDLINKVNTQTGGKVKMTAAPSAAANNNQIFNFVAGDNATSSTKITLFDGVANNGTYTSDNATTSFFETNLGISITKSYGLDDANGEYHLKKAQNAEFTLDGVKMYRSTNSITDIGAGITLNLLKAGEINFDIKQDTEGLKTTMEELTEKYNELVNYLNEVTSYDSETKVSGDLADVSEVKKLRSSIMSMLFDSQSVEGTTIDDSGNSTKTSVFVSMLDYGLSLNDSGMLNFDSAKFEKKIAEDIDFAERFFSGTSGFEELDVTGKAQTLRSDIDFTGKDFKLVFGDNTYDLSKLADGSVAFKLESTLTKDANETDAEFEARKAKDRAQKLLDHINSFNISGLKITMQELKVTENGQQVTGYALKFKSDDGSDFEISGDSAFLTSLGLEATKVSPEVKKGTGVFSELKSTLQSFTRMSSSDTLKGSLTLLSERLTALNKTLGEEKEKDQTKIDNYYDAMYNKWVEYEKIISNIKSQGETISQMIQAAQSQKNNS